MMNKQEFEVYDYQEERPGVSRLVVKIGHERIKAEFNKALQRKQKELKLPGFRPGKVPLNLVQRNFKPSDYFSYIVSPILEAIISDEVFDNAWQYFIDSNNEEFDHSLLEDGLNFEFVLLTIPLDFEAPTDQVIEFKRLSLGDGEEIITTVDRAADEQSIVTFLLTTDDCEVNEYTLDFADEESLLGELDEGLVEQLRTKLIGASEDDELVIEHDSKTYGVTVLRVAVLERSEDGGSNLFDTLQIAKAYLESMIDQVCASNAEALSNIYQEFSQREPERVAGVDEKIFVQSVIHWKILARLEELYGIDTIESRGNDLLQRLMHIGHFIQEANTCRAVGVQPWSIHDHGADAADTDDSDDLADADNDGDNHE